MSVSTTAVIDSAWNLLKPADTASNSNLNLTERCEKVIDAVIQKKEIEIHDADSSVKDDKGMRQNINVVKNYIADNVVGIRTHIIPPVNKDAEIKEQRHKETKNLIDIDEKVKNSVKANNSAALANNINAIESNILSEILDTVREEKALTRKQIKQCNDAKAAIVRADVANADDLQYKANDELNRQKYKCLPDVVFEYNEADKEKLKKLREKLLRDKTTTLKFRNDCIAESAVQLAGILKNYTGFNAGTKASTAEATRLLKVAAKQDHADANIYKLMMLRFTKSWVPYLNIPTNPDDESVDMQNRIFYNRVTSCLEALETYSVFSSRQWAAYKVMRPQAQIVLCNTLVLPPRLEFRDPVRSHVVPTPPPPPPPPPSPPDSYYETVTVGPYHYVIGPILDFQNIEGRVFIYVKCYDDNRYTTGTYFWVYRSQSEGLYRVFFKLIANSSIEKGYDYTQATIVHFRLQLALNKYYNKHSPRGIKNPIMLNTLSRLNYFIGNMSYLQDVSFLDTFPNRANIIPSFYSIPGESNGIWGTGWRTYPKPAYCGRNKLPPTGQAATAECCYVCLIPPTTYTSALPDPNVKMGMIGNYYMIDARYGPIIHNGFPMDNPYSGMANIKTDESRAVYEAQLAAYFPDDPAHPNFEFSRHRTQYDTTYPYIFCFTTCCLKSGCSSFEFFLEPDRYKKTFWCQGFSNFTALMSPNPVTSPVLSPVLHVVIGSMLTEPDFYLLSLRYNILNVEPLKSYYSADPRIAEFKKSTQVLMTLGTKEGKTSIYQPSLDPYPRSSAIWASKKFRDTVSEVNIKYKRRIISSNEEDMKNQRLLVQDKVKKKIAMMPIIAYAAYSSSRPERLEEAITTLLDISKTRDIEGMRDIEEKPPTIDDTIFRAKVGELRTKTLELLTLLSITKTSLIVTNVTNNIRSATMGGLNLQDPATRAIICNAIDFITESPSAAATTIIEFFSSQVLPATAYRATNITEFEDDLTDHALLCLKKNWLGGIMNNAYKALHTVFGILENRRLYYFNNAGEFVYMGDGNFMCLNPSNPMIKDKRITDLYEHSSYFDELKMESTGNIPVTVLTLANVYRLDCYYIQIPGDIFNSMSIVYQASSTIVYTREVNPQILNGMDMQIIPLNFLPDLPEVLAEKPTEMMGGGGMAGGGGDGKNKRPTKGSVTVPKSQATAAAAAEIIKKELEQRQQQQALEQQRLLEKILKLQTQQTYIENEATILGIVQENIDGKPFFIDLHTQMLTISDILTRIESLPLHQLKDAQTLINTQEQNQQKALEIIQKKEQEVKQEIHRILGQKLDSFIFSEYTSCATHRRVASYGGFFAGKMMDYFFGNHFQLPSFFKYFESYLRICIQYNTTALIYDANVPPYNLIKIPDGSSFLTPFVNHFKKMNIVFVPGVPTDGSGNEDYIKRMLKEKTGDIKAISKFLTKDFMEDTDELDTGSVVSDGSTLSAASSSTTSSYASESFCSFDENSSINSSLALMLFLSNDTLVGSEASDSSYQPDDYVPTQQLIDDIVDSGTGAVQDTILDTMPVDLDTMPVDAPDGGNKHRLTTVATTKRNRKYKSRTSPKRKSKSKSRHKRNSKVTNKTFCRKRKSYLSRKPHNKQTLRKGVKR